MIKDLKISINRNSVFMLLAAMTLSLCCGYFSLNRPIAGNLIVMCDKNAPVEVIINYGRFTDNSVKLVLTSPFLPSEKSKKIPGLYTYTYPHLVLFEKEYYIYTYSVTKSSSIKSLQVSCPGLSKAVMTDQNFKEPTLIPVSNGYAVFEWPYEILANVSWIFWFAGFALFTFNISENDELA